MRTKTFLPTLLIGPLLVLSSIALLPSAQAGTSCSVSTWAPTCTFTCDPLDTIHVSASSFGFWSVTITGECGGVTVSCTAPPLGSCSNSDGPTLTGGEGTCTLSGEGAGTCSAEPLLGPGSCNVILEIPTPLGTIYVTDDGQVWLESNGVQGLQCTRTCDEWGNCVEPDTRIL